MKISSALWAQIGFIFAMQCFLLQKAWPTGLPLNFDVIGQGVELLPQVLRYNLSSPGNLKMGGQELNESTFQISVVNGTNLARALPPQLQAQISQAQQSTYFLLMKWPLPLIRNSKLELISRQGRSLWTYDLDSLDAKLQTEWTQNLGKELVKNKDDKYKWAKSAFTSSIVWPMFSNPILEILKNELESYRFCFVETDSSYSTRLCTQPMETTTWAGGWGIRPVGRTATPPKIIVQGMEAGPVLERPCPAGIPVQFFAELESGIIYEFYAQPQTPHIVDMAQRDGDDIIEVIGWGLTPTDNFVVINKQKESHFMMLLRWQQTIGDFREFWKSEFNRGAAEINFSGKGGGTFVQGMKITKVPKMRDRVFMDSRTPKGTYVDGVKLYGVRPAKDQVSSTQNELALDKDPEFTWRAQSITRGELNKATLLVNDGQMSFPAALELYKGYPREISLRSAGIISSEGRTVLVAEGAFQYWFEDFLGITNYDWSSQRWGFAAKYFETLGNFAIGNVRDTMKSSDLLLKYRFTPGLWNRDASWGAILDKQSLQYFVFNEELLGIGVFWARSLPQLFNEVFGWFEMQKYEKWVDAEFISYLFPAASQSVPRLPSYNMNFHGKIMFTNRFFAEAGFGIKQYNIDDRVKRLNLKFSTLYATVGLGLNF